MTSQPRLRPSRACVTARATLHAKCSPKTTLIKRSSNETLFSWTRFYEYQKHFAINIFDLFSSERIWLFLLASCHARCLEWKPLKGERPMDFGGSLFLKSLYWQLSKPKVLPVDLKSCLARKKERNLFVYLAREKENNYQIFKSLEFLIILYRVDYWDVEPYSKNLYACKKF